MIEAFVADMQAVNALSRQLEMSVFSVITENPCLERISRRLKRLSDNFLTDTFRPLR